MLRSVLFRFVERFIDLWERENCGRVALAFAFHFNIMLLRVFEAV